MQTPRIPAIALGALCAAMLAACATAPVATWPLPEGVATLPVNGYPMAYMARGTGPTVVLVHGVMCDYRCWQGQLDGLSGSHRVVAVSLRHFYPEKWQGAGDRFTLMQHARDLASFIERLGQPVHLVGQSYGAHVAYEMARARPDLVRKLVLGEAPTDSLLAAQDAQGNAIRVQRAAETERIIRGGDLDGGLQFAVDAINGQGAWNRLPAFAKALVRDNAWTVVGIGKDDPPRVRCEDMGALQMPVLLVTGENTTPRFRAIVQQQAKCMPRAQVAAIPRAGHGSPYQNAADYNRAVQSFLAGR